MGPCFSTELDKKFEEFFHAEHPGVLTIENKRKLIVKRVLDLKSFQKNKEIQEEIFTQFPLQLKKFRYQQNHQQPQLSQIPEGNTGYTWRLSYPQGQQNNGRKIIVIGLRGSGKTTFINAIANAFLIGYFDKHRYHIANYGNNDQIQICDLMENQVQLQFLEIPGYGNNYDLNQPIMSQTYNYLSNNSRTVDLILLCRRNPNGGLEVHEKQILMNLAEIFGTTFVSKLLIITTHHDLGNINSEKLEEGLTRINNTYSLMPDPKIMFVNSISSPNGGEVEYAKYQTVVEAKDHILQVQAQRHQQLQIRELEEFNHRRNMESQLANLMNSIRERAIVLLPYLENYFSIMQVSPDDEAFTAEVILWNTFNPAQRYDSYAVEQILQSQFLTDAVLDGIREKANNLLVSGPLNSQQQSRNNFIRLEENRRKLLQVQRQCSEEKENRIANLLQMAQKYVDIRSEYLQQTFSEAEVTVQSIITRNLPEQLLLFLQQEPYYQGELLNKFFQLREQLFLPNINLQATQVLKI